jgi:hypothetical protein
VRRAAPVRGALAAAPAKLRAWLDAYLIDGAARGAALSAKLRDA